MSGVEIAHERRVYRVVGGRVLHLWLCRPVHRRLARGRAMLDLHGGAWTHFGPGVDYYWREALARRGIVTASAEVRLSPEHRFDAMLDDAREALSGLRSLSRELGFDPSRVGVMGGSTGGHLALSLGLSMGEGGPDRVIALWPVVDVLARYKMVEATERSTLARLLFRGEPSRLGEEPLVGRLRRVERARGPVVDRLLWLGQRLAARASCTAIGRLVVHPALAKAHRGAFESDEAMARASPLTWLCNQTHRALPPLLVAEGDRDPNLVPGASLRLVEAARRAGGDATLRVFCGLGHSFGNVPGPDADALIDAMVRWLDVRDEVSMVQRDTLPAPAP